MFLHCRNISFDDIHNTHKMICTKRIVPQHATPHTVGKKTPKLPRVVLHLLPRFLLERREVLICQVTVPPPHMILIYMWIHCLII